MALLIFLAICFFAAFSGSRWTMTSVKTWYPTLKKPSWNPPSWIFAPVWAVLYVTMAFAASLVWNQASGEAARGPMLLFGLQLFLNVLWSVFFFGMRNPQLAFREIVLLWVLIFLTTVSFWSVVPLAGLLFVPYLLWVTFAAFLNYTICHLNK